MEAKAEELRNMLRSLGRSIAQEENQTTASPAQTFVPPSHARALDTGTTLVEGMRGAGKSFWWNVLSSSKHREFLRAVYPSVLMREGTDVAQGFGAQPNPQLAPSADVIEILMRTNSPRDLWRAVIGKHVGFEFPFPQAGATLGPIWSERVSWVSANPELYDQLLWNSDRDLRASGRTKLILFDALDRLASSWDSIRPVARGLLQVALDLRSTSSIRAKIFVRPDMLEDREITDFPDYSKLSATRATLSWRRQDLYGLLFQLLGNSGKEGATFRTLSQQVDTSSWKNSSNNWALPDALAQDEGLQEDLFTLLAGRVMGSGASGHKRGKPYSWLVNHLIDGRAQVSPRSFLSAVGTAADETPSASPFALSPKGIQTGVQKASEIRVNELVTEDYPWIQSLLSPLKGLTVPCLASDIHARWRDNDVLTQLQDQLQARIKLPPRRLDKGWLGVLQDLEELGLLQIWDDGRVQMPDVYRIAFGLGRKGGVKPLK